MRSELIKTSAWQWLANQKQNLGLEGGLQIMVCARCSGPHAQIMLTAMTPFLDHTGRMVLPQSERPWLSGSIPSLHAENPQLRSHVSQEEDLLLRTCQADAASWAINVWSCLVWNQTISTSGLVLSIQIVTTSEAQFLQSTFHLRIFN